MVALPPLLSVFNSPATSKVIKLLSIFLRELLKVRELEFVYIFWLLL